MSLSDYRLQIAGIERRLPLFPVDEDIYIAAFIMFGDVELTQSCARALLALAPPHDVMITAESKGIPLIYEMAAQSGAGRYLVARKTPKVYMSDILSVELQSITTQARQKLHIDGKDAQYIKGKRVLIVDDVISTGESLHALEQLIVMAGGRVCGKMAVLAEGEAQYRDDLIFLQKLPLFNAQGQPI